jgi:hypothetical protein
MTRISKALNMPNYTRKVLEATPAASYGLADTL